MLQPLAITLAILCLYGQITICQSDSEDYEYEEVVETPTRTVNRNKYVTKIMDVQFMPQRTEMVEQYETEPTYRKAQQHTAKMIFKLPKKTPRRKFKDKKKAFYSKKRKGPKRGQQMNTVRVTEDVLFTEVPVRVPVTLKHENVNAIGKIQHYLNCDDFAGYALNCTIEAALVYNSTRKSPPLPSKFFDWCRAIRLMTTCAIDWNAECKGVTESHFSQDSVKGHVHVLNNICDDEAFATRYEDVWPCIEHTIYEWEECYTNFKAEIDEQKNSSQSWTHYDTHFKLCCARAQFRACTLDTLFMKTKCNKDEAVTLQKFSVIVSEGDVYQDCDQNVMYDNCPGGDPRPPPEVLLKLTETTDGASKENLRMFVSVFCAFLSFINVRR